MLASALMCMALNIFYESRGEPFKGQLAVAQVTMNRADEDPSRVCKVVYARNQFSWTKDHHVKPTGEAWDEAKAVAGLALNNDLPDVTNGATHFHAKGVSPGWKYRFKRTMTIGSHIFYKPRS